MDPWKIRVNGMQTEVTGGTVGWNQLASLDPSDWQELRAEITIDGRKMTITSTSSSTNTLKTAGIVVPHNHKFYFSGYITAPENSTSAVGMYTNANAYYKRVFIPYGTAAQIDSFFESTDTYYVLKLVLPTGALTGEYMTSENTQLFDLTQMFGATIADHIYALEQSTPGSGVAYFRKLFPDSYYPYNAGELVSRDLEGVALRGIPKLDADGNLYFDGDVYSNDGTVIRRFGYVDLGSLTWSLRTTGTNSQAYSSALPANYQAKNLDSRAPEMFADKYNIVGSTRATTINATIDSMSDGLYGFRDTGESNVIYAIVPLGSPTPTGSLLYALANPVTEQAEPWTIPQALLDTSSPALPGRASSAQFISFGVDLRSLVIGCYYSPSVSITSAEGISWPAGQVQRLLDFGYHDNGACWVRTAGGLYEVGSMDMFNEWRL